MPPPTHPGGLRLLPPLLSTASLPSHVSAPLFLGPTPHLITPLISLSITIVHPHCPPHLGLSAKTTERQACSFQNNLLLSQKTCPEFPRPTGHLREREGAPTLSSAGPKEKGRPVPGSQGGPRSQHSTGLGRLHPGLVYFDGL